MNELAPGRKGAEAENKGLLAVNLRGFKVPARVGEGYARFARAGALWTPLYP